MQYVKLGSTGVKVSRMCLGTMSFGNMADWTLEVDAARPIVNKALDLGINFFDTANIYSWGRAEQIVSELIVKEHRDDAVIATKVRGGVGPGPNDQGLSRFHIMREVQKSLKRLGTDHIDLYQIHRWDYDTPIEETLLAMNDLVRQGKVHYIGASSMAAWQFAKALFTSDRLGIARFVTMQNNYNLLTREEEKEMIPLCSDQNIALIPWSPLAGGFLSGSYKKGEAPSTTRGKGSKVMQDRLANPDDTGVLEALTELSKEKGVRPAQIALSWLLHKGVTSPIFGATKVQHVEDAVAAIDVKLSSDEIQRLEQPYKERALKVPTMPGFRRRPT
ncbi:MAG: aldo/keto reductase [Nitrososphaerota archaeon]|jgi:aryl-alcohol dehydrogenase-like predicted oxidoreductase|nr:aldo/keto reductase [Nitrososphaerota archaeon]MDG6923330.1 aldo/keto reductase [Nitrososphaerota archaeon]